MAYHQSDMMSWKSPFHHIQTWLSAGEKHDETETITFESSTPQREESPITLEEHPITSAQANTEDVSLPPMAPEGSDQVESQKSKSVKGSNDEETVPSTASVTVPSATDQVAESPLEKEASTVEANENDDSPSDNNNVKEAPVQGQTSLRAIEEIYGFGGDPRKLGTDESLVTWTVSSIQPGSQINHATLEELAQNLFNHPEEFVETEPAQLPSSDSDGNICPEQIQEWVSSICPDVKRDHEIFGAGGCVILTDEKLDMIPYPRASQHFRYGPIQGYEDLSWRQLNRTSDMEMKRLEGYKHRIRLAQDQVILDQQQPKHVHEEAPLSEINEASWPKADCVMRPAEPGDFDAIAVIINRERKVTQESQVLNVERTTAADIRRLHNYCRTWFRPFIVAIPSDEDLADRSKWPKDSDKQYKAYMEFRKHQVALPKAVVGFAYITEANTGLLNQPCAGSRFEGRLEVMVDPGHRGKMYGKALVDRIMRCISPFHNSVIDSQWNCYAPREIYEQPVSKNRRQYLLLYVNAAVRGREATAFKIMDRVAKTFGMELVTYRSGVLKTDEYFDSKWLDEATWELKVQTQADISDKKPGAIQLQAE